MTKARRVAEFLGRMDAAPCASTAGGAFDLLTKTFVAVEDELASDEDRMFPPSGDFYHDVDDRDDLLLFRQAGHETVIRTNGAILIRNRRTKAVPLDKPGRDGRKVNL